MKSAAPTLLLVDDDPADARLIHRLLDEVEGPTFAVVHADTFARARQRLSAGGIDVILLALTLPDGHGLDAVRRMRQTASSLPIVVLTGQEDEELALAAVRDGAQEYLVKGTINGHALVRCLRYAIERERLMSELAAARDEAVEATRLKSEFLATISHELRTPLTAILGFSALLRRNRGGHCDERELHHLERIHENGKHLLAVIDDLLDLSKIGTGKITMELAEVDAAEAVDRVVETLLPLAEERDIDIEVVAPNALPPVLADPLRLHQILLNLGANAVKFTREGSVTFTLAETEGSIAFAIRDTGIGIADGAIEHIFEEFRQGDASTTREFGGTGLGLSVSRSLARLLGGEIVVESALGVGSTFTLRLPAAPTPPAPAETAEALDLAGHLVGGAST